MRKPKSYIFVIIIMFVLSLAACTRTASKTPIVSEVPTGEEPVMIPSATFEIPKVMISTQTSVVPQKESTKIEALGIGTLEGGQLTEGTPGGMQSEITPAPGQEGELPVLEETVDNMMQATQPTWSLTPGTLLTGTSQPGMPTFPTAGSGQTSTPQPAYKGVPGMATFGVISVAADQSVTIQANEFPVDTHYMVFMGHQGTQAINGINIGSFETGAGGSFTGTFTIPVSLKGSSVIDIRIVFEDGKYAYNYFYNTTS